MSDLTHTPTNKDPISPEWVNLDGKAMEARKEAYKRQAHEAHERWLETLKRSEEQLQELLAESPEDSRPAEDKSLPREVKQRSRPQPLIERLQVENLKSLAGAHEIPLAPLTLIYGPNSAGKSTVLKALQMFMHAVETGTFDALDLWRRAFPDTSPYSIITGYPQPGDVPTSKLGPLVLGVDYRIPKSGEVAHAALEFAEDELGPRQASTMGLANGSDTHRKEYSLNREGGDPIDRGDFGDIGPKWEVTDGTGEERTDPVKRDVDHLLFGHADDRLQRTLFRLAGQLSHFGPHRGNPAAKYSPVNLDDIAGPAHWGIGGTPRWGIKDFDGYEVLNEVLHRLDIPHEFQPTFTYDQNGALARDWHLVDTRSNAPVALSEVGYGVSQLLPVIDSCVHANQRIITIEEPELHLHPRLQAGLANLFALSVLHRGNQVIAETHSESLLLRVRRLVRSGKLMPDEVAILYVNNTPEAGVSVRRLRLGEQGELLDPWPTGFFDDSLDDVLGGWE